MDAPWVDFKQVKQTVSMEMLVERYQFSGLKSERDELIGRCPVHKGAGERSFHISLTKNAFHCFSCKKRGNVLDLVAALEQCTVRDAAVKLAEWFAVTETTPLKKTSPASQEVDNRSLKGEVTQPISSREEATGENEPLKFQLKEIDPAHPYLGERKITKELATHFGVGFFAGKGSMQGRIVIPIHNGRGELVAYAGRTITESKNEPRYKFPNGFQKSRELYNLHRVLARAARTVIVVEGFFSCMQIAAAGFPCVALMGSSLSERQRELLATHFSGVLVLLDGDAAGRSGADECLVKLGRSLWIKSVMLPDGVQPDHLTSEQLTALLA